jgi:hypothetical protein
MGHSLVHDRIQCFDDVKIDFIVVVSNAGPPPRDGTGKCTHTVHGRSGEPRYAGHGENFGHERWGNDDLSQRIWRGGQWMPARI